MNVKKISYLILAGALLCIMTACGSYANNYGEPVDAPARFAYERTAGPRRVTRGAARRRPFTRTAIPKPVRQESVQEPTHSAPKRVVPHSAARPHGPVIQLPDSQAGNYVPAPQSIQTIPQEPAAIPAAPHTPTPAPTPTADNGKNAQITRHISEGRELASHKTEFNEKDESRTTNITRASNSINGHIVRPGETFSYNQTVGPTIERRGYKEGTIFVKGEKKKGFGGGVCQVSTTLSVAADDAGMTIVERHDHSLPVSYAKEGEEAATSY